MRAVLYRESGPADQVLEMADLPDPEPRRGQVRIRLCFSGVNPTDWKRRSAEDPRYEGFQVPHHDGSGFVDQVGEGVSPERAGQRVWIYHGAVGQSLGTAAEYICVDERQAVPLPDHVSLIQGATLGIPYLTAAHAFSFASPRKPLNILVQGGAGAVGFAATQIARHQQARVVTTVSEQGKAEIAQMALPDVILNYRSQGFPGQLASASGEGFDLVTEVDLKNNLPFYVEHLRLGAHVASYASDGSEATVPARSLMFRNASVHFFVVYLLPSEHVNSAVATVQALLDSAALNSLPIHEYALGDVAHATTTCRAASSVGL